MYAPNGEAQFSGSDTTTFHGLIAANDVHISGSDFTMYGTGGAVDFELALVE